MRSEQAETAYRSALLRALSQGRVWAHMRGSDVSHRALRACWWSQTWMTRWGAAHG